MKVIGFAIAALAFSGMVSAQAGQVESGNTASHSGRIWSELQQIGDKSISFDRASIERGKGKFRYTGRTLFPRPDENGVIELQHLGEIRCAAKSFRIISLTAYAADGRVVASYTVPDSEKPGPIGANTPNDKLHSEYCS
jgi:hypothetical protein